MFKNYFKITIRNLARSGGYSFINIFGLSLGIACCLLTANYVVFEFSYDNFHPDGDRTYRVDQTMIFDPEGGVFGSTSPAVAVQMLKDYPEVEEAMRINTPGDFVVRYAAENGDVLAFDEDKVFAADSNFFRFFGFKLKEGDPVSALRGVDKVVLSEETALKFFGDKPAVGKFLQIGNDRRLVEVTGVTEAQPENTHFKFKYLLSIHTNPNVKKFEWSWIWTQVVTYVKLRPDADPVALENKMARLGDTVIKPSFERFGVNYDEFMQGKGYWTFYLRPIHDIHLRTNDNRLGTVGDVRYPYAFGAIGVFVLVIAAINFINLSTARATKRAKEVGVKKSLGALRTTLMGQFQTESFLLALFSTVLAIPLIEGLRLLIVTLLKDDLPFMLWSDPIFYLGLPVAGILIGFLAGLYPSFYLTSFVPVQVLKGKVASGPANSGLRNALVIIQFAISIALLVGTVVVTQQMEFIRTTNLGYEKENTLVINSAERLGSQMESFRDEIATLPGVESAALAMDVPRGFAYEDIYSAIGSSVKLPVNAVKIDDHFFQAMGFKLVAGRSFDFAHNQADETACIVNETLVKLFGWTPEEALGKLIISPGDDDIQRKVIGVMGDFHFQSLRSNINPLIFEHIRSNSWGTMRVLAVKYNTTDVPDLVRLIESQWNKAVEQTPMNFTMLEDDLAQNYREDQRLGDMFAIFASLSIVIAVIGLVGLVAYSTEIRKKEIGIRKVLGASSSGIVLMMNSHYARLIVVGLILAIPASWYAMNYWLETFEYRISISPFNYLVAGVAVLVASMLSVGYLSLRAASVNPASVLKEE